MVELKGKLLLSTCKNNILKIPKLFNNLLNISPDPTSTKTTLNLFTNLTFFFILERYERNGEINANPSH